MISPEDGKKLLELARISVKTFFSNEIPEDDYLKEKFQEKQGVFVTIHKNEQLRGCIGFPEPVLPLHDAIIEAARSAAFSDPRFEPLIEEELEEIDFELSVLTVPKRIHVKTPKEYLDLVKIGRDGLIIRGYRSGLLLPQVAVEYKMNAQRFLECVCEKAGMEKNAWTDLNNKIFSFQAQIFSENEKEDQPKDI